MVKSIIPLHARRAYGRALRSVTDRRSRANEVRELKRFIQSFEVGFRRRLLTGLDPARVVSLQAFRKFLLTRSELPRSIAVVSGSDEEPEIALLQKSPNPVQLSFSEDPALYDLGEDWSQPAWSQLRALPQGLGIRHER